VPAAGSPDICVSALAIWAAVRFARSEKLVLLAPAAMAPSIAAATALWLLLAAEGSSVPPPTRAAVKVTVLERMTPLIGCHVAVGDPMGI
jgi:hypothetical protein